MRDTLTVNTLFTNSVNRLVDDYDASNVRIIVHDNCFRLHKHCNMKRSNCVRYLCRNLYWPMSECCCEALESRGQ